MKLQDMFKARVRLLALLFFVAFVVQSCKDKDKTTPNPETPEYLIEGTPAKTLGKEEIAREVAGINPLLGGLVKHGARLYKVTYRTKNVDGNTITASGAVAFPVEAGNAATEFPMLSVQHGTIFPGGAAPSDFDRESDMSTYGALFASLGYITVLPDYIGYGASKDLPHPYEHRASLASASLDMLRAVKELIAVDGTFRWNRKLFISGFSEGGYATLALQKELEEEAGSEFNLVASTCGAGAYNKTAFMKHLVNETTHGDAGYNRSYLWVLLSYNSIYGLNKPVSYYFREPYAATIEKDREGARIGVSFNTILNDAFKKAVNEGTDKAFVDAVGDNDLLDWKPVTPTQLYHGTADELVFYLNSETTYNAMKARGATSVELKKLEGKTHATAVADYLIGTYSFFTSKQ